MEITLTGPDSREFKEPVGTETVGMIPTTETPARTEPITPLTEEQKAKVDEVLKNWGDHNLM